MILPENRTAAQVEGDTRCNEMIRRLCQHELRLAPTFAYADGRSKATPADYYRAVMSTQEARRIIYRLYATK